MISNTVTVLCSLLVSGCVLAHLGYDIHRDQLAAAAAAEQAKQAEIQYRRSLGLAAWNVEKEHHAYNLVRWMESNSKIPKGQWLDIPWVFIKLYQNSDVVWLDQRHVRVSGFLNPRGRAPKDKLEWIQFEADLQVEDDGTWSGPHSPKFEYSTLSEATTSKWRMWAIKSPLR